jgi:hypothetical protein
MPAERDFNKRRARSRRELPVQRLRSLYKSLPEEHHQDSKCLAVGSRGLLLKGLREKDKGGLLERLYRV